MNKIYLVEYDIKDDKALIERIKSLGAWMNYFDGNWFVKSTLSAKEVYDRIAIGYEEERILIVEVSNRNYWGVMPKDAWDWISKI